MTWTKDTPNSASWTKPTNSGSWAESTANATSWITGALKSFLLLEDGYKLLQNNASGILLELSINSEWSKESAGAGVWSKL